MKLNIIKIYKPAVFCVLLLLLKSMLVSAQAPVPQFWQLNNSSRSGFTWDNTPWNGQINNLGGTFSASSLTWTTSGGRTNSKIDVCKDIVFGGNPGVGAAGTVTLSAALSNVKSIAFHPAESGNFTLSGGSITSCSANLPVSVDSGLSPSISSVFSGTNSFTKNGIGTLTLSGNNTYTGSTSVTDGTLILTGTNTTSSSTVNAGILQIGVGTAAGSIGTGPVDVSSGATLMWNKGASNFTLNNSLSGTGTIWFQGTNSNITQNQSAITLRGNNSGFSGVMRINKAIIALTNSQSQLGSASIFVEQGGTLQLQTIITYNNIITLGDKCGWYYNDPTAKVLGGLRLQSGASISGDLILNNTTNVGMGDSTGLNSAIGMWEGGSSSISGIISGPGNLSMSCTTAGNTNGSPTPPPPISISLTGTLSNTYSGITVVNGQQRIASLLLRKTGGAVAIPANGTVWMGNNTGGNGQNQPGVGAESNLRMGDDQNTGSTQGTARNQWDNQFGANVVMQFNNIGGNYTRFDLQGTNQTLAGITFDPTVVIAPATVAGIVQNQNINGFNPANPATLTLNGSGNYIYNGIMRDKDNNNVNPADPNQLNLVWSGSGSQTLVGPNIKHTGTTAVNSGRLVCYNTTNYNSDTSINSGGIFEMNVTSGTISGAYTISGAGSLVKTGAGAQTLSGNNTYSGGTTINEGTLTAGHINAFGTGTITVNTGTTLNRNGFAITNTVINNGGTVL